MGQQFAIKEVYNVTIWDYATKKPFVYIDYATTGTNEVTTENTEVRGGQGNGLLTDFDHTKNSNFNLSVPLVDLKLLAMLGGDDLVTGTQNAFKREELTIANGKVTLTETPIADSLVVFGISGRDLNDEYEKVESAPTAKQYSISSKDLTFDSGENGKVVSVWYQFATPATSQKVTIKANKFPKTVFITGEGLWRDIEEATDKAVAMKVHKCKPQGNITLTTSATDVTTLDLTFKMFTEKGTNGDLDYIDYVVL